MMKIDSLSQAADEDVCRTQNLKPYMFGVYESAEVTSLSLRHRVGRESPTTPYSGAVGSVNLTAELNFHTTSLLKSSYSI